MRLDRYISEGTDPGSTHRVASCWIIAFFVSPFCAALTTKQGRPRCDHENPPVVVPLR
jgi:hypothetical protein